MLFKFDNSIRSLHQRNKTNIVTLIVYQSQDSLEKKKNKKEKLK